MVPKKIVFSGSPGAGKTTAIATLSGTAPLVTDVRNHDVSLNKQATTVGLDYGQLDLGQGDAVRLFGTPGQDRFDFMWEILAQDALGLVLLIDNSMADPLSELEKFLFAYQRILPNMNCVVGISRAVGFPYPSPEDYVDVLTKRGLVVPVLAVDVRRREDVLLLIDTVLMQAEMRHAE